MPRSYEVQSRSAATGEVGLVLPFPPTRGPLVVRHSVGFHHVAMGGHVDGKVQEVTYGGVYTTGVSDCVVVASLSWKNGTWRRFFFTHLNGGMLADWQLQQMRMGLNSYEERQGALRFFVLASNSTMGLGTLAGDIADALSVPLNNFALYGSYVNSMNFALSFTYGLFGETLPLVGRARAGRE